MTVIYLVAGLANIVTGARTGLPGFKSQQIERFFVFCAVSKLVPGIHLPSYSLGTGGSFPMM
jgi:hypothetical protein